jgi:hypothetical protein
VARPRRRPLEVEVLEDRYLLSTLYALDYQNDLLAFDSSTPNTIAQNVAITGLQNNDNMVAIAFRPHTGTLYGLGTGGSGNVDLYTIDTGANFAHATFVGSAAVTLNFTNDIAFSFDPVLDQARVTTDNAQNFRLNPATGALVQPVDTALAYADGTSGGPFIGAIAYTNPFDGAAATALYALDFFHETMVQLGDASQTPPISPNSGELFTVGRAGSALEFNFSDGFTIATDGTGYASLNTTDSGGNFVVQLYTIDLHTGLATLVSPASGDAKIGDGSSAPRSLAVAPEQVFQFSARTYTVQAGSSTVQATISVDRVGGSSGAVSVNYQTTSGGTGVAGTDYNTASGTLTWNDGDTTPKEFTVTILSDQNAGGDRTVNLALGQPSTGTALGSQNTAVLTIHPPVPLETIQLDTATYTVAAGGGATQVQVQVDRTGSTAGTVDVPFQVTDGSALAGRDYTVVNTTPLEFQPGMTHLDITLNIVGDTSATRDKSFTVALGMPTSPGGTASPGLGATSEAGVTILEPETFTITAPIPVSEKNGAEANYTITRRGPTDGDAMFEYSFGGTAIPGVDFALVPGPVLMTAGHTTATIPLPIIDSGVYDGNETLVVTLTGINLSTANEAVIDVPNSAMTTIIDTNPPPPLTGNVTSFVSVGMPPTPHGKHAHPNMQVMTLTNTSVTPIQGPVSVVLVGLNKHIKLIGLSGLSAGWGLVPYLNILPDGALFQPGTRMMFALQFANPGHRALHYVPVVIAGPGGR